MVLEADVTGGGHAVLSTVSPLAGSLACEPVLAPCIELDSHLSVQQVSHMAVVKDDLALVPLASRLEITGLEIRNVHCIVDTAPLPRLEDVAIVHLCKVIIVDELVLGTGDIRHVKTLALHDMIHHAAVAALANLPFPLEMEVRVFLVSDYVAVFVASMAFGLDGAVNHGPGSSEGRSVIVSPTLQRSSVKQELPAFGLLLGSQRVLFRSAACDREGRKERRSGPINQLFHIHSVIKCNNYCQMVIRPIMSRNSRISRTTDTVTQPQPQPIPFLAPSVNPLSPSPLCESTRPIRPPTRAHVKMNFNIVNKFNTFPDHFQ